MKHRNTLFAILFLAGAVILSSCKDPAPEPEKTPEEKQIEALTGTWDVTSVNLDNSDITSDWPGFSVDFSGAKSYTSTNSSNANVWPNSGSYTLDPDDVTIMLRSGNGAALEISCDVTDNTLRMTFEYDTDIHGRLKGTDGVWVFSMARRQ